MTEHDMLTGARLCCPRAFAALVASYQGMLYGQIRARLAFLSRDDLYQAALFGLWRAAVTYDPAKGVFSSHAWRRVRAEVRRCVVKFAGDVHLGDEGTQRGRILRATHYQDDAYSEMGGLDAFARAQPEQERAAMRRDAIGAVRAAVRNLAPRARAVMEARWLAQDEPLPLSKVREGTKQAAQYIDRDARSVLAKDARLRAIAVASGWDLPVDKRRNRQRVDGEAPGRKAA